MTELIWEGKYDKDGKKVAPLHVALPFQTVETINESTKERQLAQDLFTTGRDPQWRNRLIWGDKKYVLPSLLEEFAGKVDLIYIDPPFATGQNFSFNMRVDGEEFTKEPSIIEQKAYRDTWGRGLDSYLQWFSEAVIFLQELLSERGSIFVHLDCNIGPYAKAAMDELFSRTFQTQVVWQRVTAHSDSRRFGINYDLILHYSKAPDFTWIVRHVAHSEDYVESHYTQVNEEGRKFRWDNATAAGSGPARYFFGKLLEPPPGTHWRWSQERIDDLGASGRIALTSKGKPQYKRFLDEMPGKVIQAVWTDIAPVNSQALEDTGFDTQKPEALLERIIKASSNEGDLVLDCFVGSGTTAVVAEKLNRRWIACDLGRFAIHTTRKRLLGTLNVKPFVVQNLGKYERQLWQKAEFDLGTDLTREDLTLNPFPTWKGTSGSPSHSGKGPGIRSDTPASPSHPGKGPGVRSADLRYRHFILELYHAQSVSGYVWLHGVKAGRMVHVGAVDAPISPGDVSQIAAEFKRAVGTGKDAPITNGVDVLGWDFAFELNEVSKQQAAQANINMRFVRIPREVLEKKAVEQGDIRFFELAALSVDMAQKGRVITLKLTDFVIPPDDVPEDVRKAITHWEQWIDYWAVDWNNRSDTFHNEWQDYRTRQKRDLQKQVAHTYEQPGQYIIVVKVIDILGNDTTKTLKVTVV